MTQEKKVFVVRIEKDAYRHSLKLLGYRGMVRQLTEADLGITPGITTCGFMVDGKLVQEPVDCPKCLAKKASE